MSERRMTAYYYSFDATNVPEIDKVLGAVACAGKAFHNTEAWQDELSPSEDHTGECPVEWIQNAGNEAASDLAALRALNAELVEALERVTREADLDGLREKAGWDCWLAIADAALTRAREQSDEGEYHG